MITIKRKPRAEALLQILILVFGIIAISYAIGSSVEVVGAEGSPCPNGDEDCKDIICAKPNHEPYCNEDDVCDCKPVEESQDQEDNLAPTFNKPSTTLDPSKLPPDVLKKIAEGALGKIDLSKSDVLEIVKGDKKEPPHII